MPAVRNRDHVLARAARRRTDGLPWPAVAMGAALLLLAAPKARALWIEVQVTPRYPTTLNRSFHVSVRQRDGQEQFEVTFERSGGKPLSPFLSARLLIASAEVTVGTVPLEERRSEGKVTYWFRLSPGFLSNSRFELDESAFVTRKGEDGKPKDEQVMGGTSFWFFLRDFARAAGR